MTAGPVTVAKVDSTGMPRAVVIGVRQTLLGLAVVAATAIGVLWT